MYRILRRHRKIVEPVDTSISRYHLEKSVERSAEVDKVLARTEKRIRENHLAQVVRTALEGPKR